MERDRAWRAVRPELTTGVFGQDLWQGEVRIVLTRVDPGGKFALHRDAYGHLFNILSGEGVFQVGTTSHPLSSGASLEVAPGELHGYENRSNDQLVLLSLNLPPKGR